MVIKDKPLILADAKTVGIQDTPFSSKCIGFRV
jgi:hypothetical protein